MSVHRLSASDDLDAAQMDQVAELLAAVDGMPSEQAWERIASRHGSNLPFPVSLHLWQTLFRDRIEQQQPVPMWFPNETHDNELPIRSWMHEIDAVSVAAFHSWSADSREAFWEAAVRRLGIPFRRKPDEVMRLAESDGDAEWLKNARLNIVDACFQAPADAPAIVAGSTGGVDQTVSYGDLRSQVSKFSAALTDAGFEPGACIAVYMPMTVKSVIAYLGIIHAGCVAVSIADSFAPPEIAKRLAISKAQGVVTYFEMKRGAKTIGLYESVCKADAPRAIVIHDDASATLDLRGGDITWEDLHSAVWNSDALNRPALEAGADDPINILFSSGTTGDPKAIPWTHATPIKCATDAMLLQGVTAGDVLAWPTNLGWMMGPWLIFAALMNRATMALHEDLPTGPSFGEFVQNAGVTMLGVIPTLVKSWRAQRCMESFDWSSVRCFSSTGESSQAEDMFYLSWLAGFRPVIEYCGGTEIGGGYISSTMIQPNIPAAFSTLAFGLDAVILNDQHKPADEGELFLIGPSIGLSQSLLNKDHQATYFAGAPAGPNGEALRKHGDHFRMLPGGYYAAGGRIDDTMNLGGIKVSSAEIERVLNHLPGIRETAAVAYEENEGGSSRLCVFIVAESDAKGDAPALADQDEESVLRQMNQQLRRELNPLFKASRIEWVDALPRTASNKVMRRSLRARLRSS